ncbi:amino acid adenylation domain-containing protein [Streptomyces sp. NPDC052052]|uniref:amino acid adenylation domain-containing protein n=1 Tax=Streptomyces sp. NPDC052052 TaxID=3154756 RepID=UPI00341EE08E
MRQAAPYGAWTSPISAADVAATDSHPNWPGFVGEEIWWSERLPHEGGRTTLMRVVDGVAHSALPAPWNVRSRVMDYGGRAWAGAMTADGPLIVFVHAGDQRLYRYAPASPGAEPRPLTPPATSVRSLTFADPVLWPGAGAAPTEVWCVRESTGPDGAPERDLVAVPLDGTGAQSPQALRLLTEHHDFFTGPRLAPDGCRVAWIGWDHPAMPWDASWACVAEIRDDGSLSGVRAVAGGPEESVAQVEWTDDGELYVITDRSGWWNVHRADLDGGASVNVCAREEEFAGALTKLGLTWCAPLPGGRLAVVHGTHAMGLSILDPVRGELFPLDGPFTEWAPLLASDGDRLIAVGAGPDRGFTAVRFDTDAGTCTPLSTPRATVEPALLPRPEGRTFEGPDGRPVHAVVFPPRNPHFGGLPAERPPYVVFAHSGPTSRFPLAYDLQIAYLTSRGIGVVGVNYSGSTGYGRAYRNRLRNAWGVADVADCAQVARALAAEGSADPDRLAIRGASAGGWTAAVSLTTLDTYCCAALYYPVLDPVSWRESQNGGFEAFYLDTLIGPWPQAEGTYVARSPAHAAARVDVPFLLFQGSADPICPPAQAEAFLAGVSAESAPYRHLVFEGERHGFKRDDTLIECVEAELALYCDAFGVPGDAGGEPPELIHEVVRAQALRTPDRPAVQDAEGSWTYAELLVRAEEVSRDLVRSGARPGDRIGLHLDRSRDLVAGVLATLLTGCSYLPLDPEYPAERLRFMVEDARPVALLTRRSLPDPPHGAGQRLVYVDADSGAGTSTESEPGAAVPSAGTPDDAAVVIYTSGSTGTPKGAVLAHRGLVHILRHSKEAFGFTEDDSVLALAAFSFDFAQLEILLPLVSGGTVHLVDRAVARDPELLDEALDARGATFVMGTPSMFSALTSFGWRPSRRLRVVSGGESLTPALIAALGSAGSLWNIYGPTETSIYSLYEKVPTAYEAPPIPAGATPGGAPDITIGRPVPGTVVEILRDGDRCADGETGEIHIGGPGLALGYLDRPELTDERFVPDPFRPGERLYRTGDLARRGPDGRVVYVGRTDDQVKIRGHRVELGEVEQRLAGLDGVRAAAVVAERGHHSLRLVAYVVPADGAPADTGALRSRLARELPAYALPHRIVAVQEIPLSPNGKTDRRALSSLDRPLPAAGDELAGVWREVLGLAEILPTSSFFDLGGDSLSAMEVAIRARALGIHVRPADLYATRTFGELSQLAEARRADGPAPARSAQLPTALSPAQHRFLEWDYKDGDHYNVSMLLDVADSVDRTALEEALARLAERHPALRLRLTGPVGAPVPLTDRAAKVPLSWHELPADDHENAAFLEEADLLQRSLSLREGPVWRAAFCSGPTGHRLLLVFHHFVADGMSLKILARDLSALYEAAVTGTPDALDPAPATSWAEHAGTLRRFVNGPLGELFLRRWEELPWPSLRPLPAERPTGSMHLSCIKSLTTRIPLPDGVAAARVEELLISALVAATAEEGVSRTGAVDVCRHGRTDPSGGPGYPDAVGWLNSIAPYVLSLPEQATDAETAALLRRQITEIRDMEQTWGALRHLHDDEWVRRRLAALPAPDVYLNFLGSRMHDLELSGPFRLSDGAVGTEMTPERTQPYRIKIYAETAPDTLRLQWQYSSDVHDEERIFRLAQACAHWFERFDR